MAVLIRAMLGEFAALYTCRRWCNVNAPTARAVVDKYIQAMPECIESDKVTGARLFCDASRGARYCPLDTLLDGLAEYASDTWW